MLYEEAQKGSGARNNDLAEQCLQPILKRLHGPSFRDLLREEAAWPGSSPPSQKDLFPTMRTSWVQTVLSSSVSEEHIVGDMGFSGETVGIEKREAWTGLRDAHRAILNQWSILKIVPDD